MSGAWSNLLLGHENGELGVDTPYQDSDHNVREDIAADDSAAVSARVGVWGSSLDDDEEQGPQPSLVRPYTLTSGRTKSEVYLPLEAPVHTISAARASSWPASDVRSKITTLCMHGPSVAEISARLYLPLGVARVLVGDLVELGILRVSATLDDDATADERRELIGRTLRGLRAL